MGVGERLTLGKEDGISFACVKIVFLITLH